MSESKRVHRVSALTEDFARLKDGSQNYLVVMDNPRFAIGDLFHIQECEILSHVYTGHFLRRELIAIVTKIPVVTQKYVLIVVR